MMVRYLHDLPKDELKKLIDGYFDVLCTYSKQMMSVNPIGLSFYDLIYTLRTEFKNDMLDFDEMRELTPKLTKYVIDFIPGYTEKLMTFTGIRLQLELEGVDFNASIMDHEAANIEVGKMTSLLKTEKNTESYFHSMLLLAQNYRATIIHDFNDSLKKLSNVSDYDIGDILSCNGTIQKGEKNVPRIQAIRDAVAHLNYSIIEENGSFKIKFDNMVEGYNFTEQYTLHEFWLFMNHQNNYQKLLITIIYLVYLFTLFKVFYK